MALFVLFFLLIANVSATHATYDISDSWSFQEDVFGENKGFTLTHKSTIPRNYNCDFYDWTADGRKCAANRYYNGYQDPYADYSYSSYNSRNSRYSSRTSSAQPINQAFNTFRADSQAATDFEIKKMIIKKTTSRYSYYGRGIVYGYGFDGFYSRPGYYW